MPRTRSAGQASRSRPSPRRTGPRPGATSERPRRLARRRSAGTARPARAARAPGARAGAATRRGRRPPTRHRAAAPSSGSCSTAYPVTRGSGRSGHPHDLGQRRQHGQPAHRLVELLGQRPGVVERPGRYVVAAPQRHQRGDQVRPQRRQRHPVAVEHLSRRPPGRRSSGPAGSAAATGRPVCQCRQIGMSRSIANGIDSSQHLLGGPEPAVLHVEVGELGVAGRGQLVQAVGARALDVIEQLEPGLVVAARQSRSRPTKTSLRRSRAPASCCASATRAASAQRARASSKSPRM